MAGSFDFKLGPIVAVYGRIFDRNGMYAMLSEGKNNNNIHNTR